MAKIRDELYDRENATAVKRKPRVSIGLPVYNGERFLVEALESHLAQTYSDFELIISDNASTDQTQEICCAYARRDSRIRYYRNKENIGLYRNFNRVFQLSSSEYFKWACADDHCKSVYVMRCINELENHPTAVLTYAQAIFIDETGTPLQINDRGWNLRSEAPHDRLRYVIFAGHRVNCLYGLIRARALAQTRLLPSYRGGDCRLLGELSLMGKFHEIPEHLFFRRIHSDASSQNFADHKQLMEFFKERSARLTLSEWNRDCDHFITIIHSNLSVHHRLSLLIALLRRMYWYRRQLLHEIKSVLKTCIRTNPFTTSGSSRVW